MKFLLVLLAAALGAQALDVVIPVDAWSTPTSITIVDSVDRDYCIPDTFYRDPYYEADAPTLTVSSCPPMTVRVLLLLSRVPQGPWTVAHFGEPVRSGQKHLLRALNLERDRTYFYRLVAMDSNGVPIDTTSVNSARTNFTRAKWLREREQ